MRRCERPEPARGLLELPPAPDLVAAAGLVPGDDDVHEPLEEVLLRRLARRARRPRAPRARRSTRRARARSRPRSRSSLHAGSDANRVLPSGRRGDHPAGGGGPLHPGQARGLAPGSSPRDDRQRRRARPRDRGRRPRRSVRRRRRRIRTCRCSGSRTTRTRRGCARANEAGFDQVVAKSALDERAPELIDGLIASID